MLKTGYFTASQWTVVSMLARILDGPLPKNETGLNEKIAAVNAAKGLLWDLMRELGAQIETNVSNYQFSDIREEGQMKECSATFSVSFPLMWNEPLAMELKLIGTEFRTNPDAWIVITLVCHPNERQERLYGLSKYPTEFKLL